MHRLLPFALAPLVLLSACSEEGVAYPGATQTAALTPTAARAPQETPAAVAKRFLTAVDAQDEAAVKRCLTTKARALVGQDGGFSFQATRSESFTVGRATIDAEDASAARVPATVTTDGTEQTFELLLCVEDGAWRVHGLDVPFGDASWTISFEGEEDTLGGMLEGVAEEMANELSSSIEDAMADWAAGGSAEEIAAERARFDALASEDVEREGWQSSYRVSGSAAVVLADALRGTGYELDAGDHAEALTGHVELELTDVSRAQLVEAVAAAVGLVPVYGGENVGWGDEVQHVGFVSGPRTVPMTFVGPFVVELELEENAPRSKGTATFRARALGLPEGSLAANGEMGEYLNVADVRSAADASLLADADVTYWTSPTMFGNSLVVSVSVDLVGLLRSVETLHAVEGELVWTRARDVAETRFDSPGTKTAGAWEITCKRFDTNSEFEVVAQDDTDADAGESEVAVRFAPDAADEAPLGVLSQSAWSFGESTSASLQTPERPASVRVKAFRATKERLRFRFEDVALARFLEQPEESAALVFDGAAPVTVAFERFADRSNADFPTVELALTSTANKPVLSVQAQFRYLGRAGDLLHEFPHTLTPEPSFDAENVLLAPRGSATTTNTAFFLPEATVSLEVRVDEVEFEDGTTWKAE